MAGNTWEGGPCQPGVGSLGWMNWDAGPAGEGCAKAEGRGHGDGRVPEFHCSGVVTICFHWQRTGHPGVGWGEDQIPWALALCTCLRLRLLPTCFAGFFPKMTEWGGRSDQ